MMPPLIIIFSEVLEYFLLFLFFHKKGIKNKKEMLFSILFLLLPIEIYFKSNSLNLLIFTTSLIFISCFIYNISFIKSILFTIFYSIIVACSELLSFYFFKLFSINPISNLFYSVPFVLISLFFKAIFLFILKKIKKDNIYLKPLFPLLILPITFIILLFGIFEDYEHMNSIMRIGIILLFLSNFVIIYVFKEINNSETLKIRINNLETQEKIHKAHYKFMEEQHASNKKYIHDFNKHLNILNSLVKQNDFDTMKQYLRSMNEKQKIKNQQIITGNKTLDLALYSLGNKFDLSKINIQFDKIEKIDISHEQLYRVMAILYNSLENAIESCLKTDNPYIKIIMHTKGANYIIIKIINSTNIKSDNILKTDKDEKNDHGFGSKIICDEVEYLEGKIDYRYTNNEFQTTIVLPNFVKS